jgi:hypothetical protein
MAAAFSRKRWLEISIWDDSLGIHAAEFRNDDTAT